MDKAPYLRNAFLELILNGTAIPNLADNAATAPLTEVYVGLHTGDPSGGDQTTSETNYTGYSRKAVLRDDIANGWNITANVASPNDDVLFAQVTAGTGTITHVSIGTDVSGAGRLLWSGTISPNIVIEVGKEPKVTASSTITET